MKIIKYGKNSPVERYKCSCGCIFEIDHSTNDDKLYGYVDTFGNWKPICPECEAYTCIDKVEVSNE